MSKIMSNNSPFKKRLVWVATGATFLLLTSISMAAGGIDIFVNGTPLSTDVAPQIIENRTMAPVRAIAEALGAEVRWDANQQQVFIETSSLEATRLRLLQQALLPNDPDLLVQTWADSLQMRNGAAQFALYDPALQEQTKAAYEATHWVTGTSSPWISDYTLSEAEIISENQRVYTLRFLWKTSAEESWGGPCQVTVTRLEDQWLITSFADPGIGIPGQLR